MTWMLSSAAAALLLVLLPTACRATPAQFVANIAKTNCTMHPTSGLGRHGAPVPDARVSVLVTPAEPTGPGAGDSFGAPKALCVGNSYQLAINWEGGLRNALITTSAGRLVPLLRGREVSSGVAGDALLSALGWKELQDSCPNRYITPVVAGSVSLRLDLPANITEPELTIAVTSAGGPFDNFRATTSTLPLLPASACAASSALQRSADAAAAATVVSNNASIPTSIEPPAELAALAGPSDSISPSPLPAAAIISGSSNTTTTAAKPSAMTAPAVVRSAAAAVTGLPWVWIRLAVLLVVLAAM